MKKAILGLSVIGALVAVVATGAFAGNIASGTHTTGATCGGSSCFVPSFSGVGAVAKYRTSGAAASVVTFADCCTAGDKYKVSIRAVGSPSADSYTFTSFGAQNGGCDFAPYANQRQVAPPGGTKNVSMTAVALPGGAPASAYLSMNTTGWVQTAGVDSCGF